VNLAQVGAEHRVQRSAYIEIRLVPTAIVPDRRERGCGRWSVTVQVLEHALNFGIALIDLQLHKIIHFECMTKSEYMFRPIISSERFADRVDRLLASDVAMLCK
jgi:hypothetical protein